MNYSMKKAIVIFAICMLHFPYSMLHAQVSINTDNSAPDPSAMLDVRATDKGLLIPRLTNVQIDQIASPATGLQVYSLD
ncbi:MAG: hypothetical protein KDC61_22700, partial [Saprospiraceae bacterium]|nr:hypothetical protein [Saprospiraceae bacterium]